MINPTAGIKAQKISETLDFLALVTNIIKLLNLVLRKSRRL